MSRRRIAFNLMILGYFLGGLGIWFYTRFEESTNGALLGIMLILSGGASFCAGVVSLGGHEVRVRTSSDDHRARQSSASGLSDGTTDDSIRGRRRHVLWRKINNEASNQTAPCVGGPAWSKAQR